MTYDPAETARLIALELPIAPYTQQRLQEQLRAAVERITELEDHLRTILPMAKGYAHEHPVGGNWQKCDQAYAALNTDQGGAGEW